MKNRTPPRGEEAPTAPERPRLNLADRYVLGRRLAVGGMAEVFLATQRGLMRFERTCVIKRIRKSLASDPALVEMFLDEARLVAQLSHHNIASVLDFGEERGSYFIAFEYVAGKDLAKVIAEHRRRGRFIAWPQAVRIVAEIANGLDHAHKAVGIDGSPLNVVHRDVSPSNVLVGRSGEVKLIDFGVAKASGARRQTMAGTIKGKMAYMSPEQVLGQHVDARSDIFCLGLVLFELLSNRPAVDGNSLPQMFERIVKGPLPSILKYRRDVPKAIASILARALNRDVDHRFNSAAEMSSELERVLTQLGLTVTSAQLGRLVSAAEDDRPTQIHRGLAGGLPASTGYEPARGSREVTIPRCAIDSGW